MLGGIILLVALALAMVGFGFLGFKLLCGDDMSFAGYLSVVVSGGLGIAVIIMLIMVPFSRNADRRSIQKFKAFEATVHSAREVADSDYERWKLTEEIASWNCWLAGVQHDLHNYWGLWTANEVEGIKPIK